MQDLRSSYINIEVVGMKMKAEHEDYKRTCWGGHGLAQTMQK